MTDDGGRILSKGQMGYWESSEMYPSEDPHGRWCELCGTNIRHHKFPDEQLSANVGDTGGPSNVKFLSRSSYTSLKFFTCGP